MSSLEAPADASAECRHEINPHISLVPNFHHILFYFRPSNLLLDQSNIDVSAFRTTGDWLNGFRTGQCKDIFTGVEYSTCDTIAKISTE